MTEEKKEYLSIEEAAKYVGIKRAALYYYIRNMEIKTYKFRLSKKAYMTFEDAERIKEVKEKPWLAGLDEEKTESKKETKAS